MEELISTKYDSILIGTDTPTSILSAAFSRSGEKILHIDTSNYYGSIDGTLSLSEYLSLSQQPPNLTFRHFQTHVMPVTSIKAETEECLKFPRRFNIDLQPKFVYSVGEVVDWTVNCGVSLYLEFKPLEAGVLWDRNGIRRVPCNKSEIFADESLSVVEKRLLMKFIEYCSKLLEDGSFDAESSFKQVMEDKKLPKGLQNILLYAILLLNDEDVTLAQALGKMEKYVSSLGIYKDNCALLYPMYGSSDIPQGFCRMCAVYEGTYVITEELKVMSIENNAEEIIVNSSFGELKGNKVYLNVNYASLDSELVTVDTGKCFRAVALCRGLLKESDGPVLLSVPPEAFGNPKVVYVLQLSESSSTVPSGYSMIHIWSESCGIETVQELLYSTALEIVFLSSYDHFTVECKGKLKHVYNSGGIEILEQFQHAKALFNEAKPGFEFLPQRHNEEEDILKDI